MHMHEVSAKWIQLPSTGKEVKVGSKTETSTFLSEANIKTLLSHSYLHSLPPSEEM